MSKQSDTMVFEDDHQDYLRQSAMAAALAGVCAPSNRLIRIQNRNKWKIGAQVSDLALLVAAATCNLHAQEIPEGDPAAWRKTIGTSRDPAETIEAGRRLRQEIAKCDADFVSGDAFLTVNGHTIFDSAIGEPAKGTHDCRVWKRANTWYLLAAGNPDTIWTSPDLKAWTCQGPMVDAFNIHSEVPDFQTLGDKDILTNMGDQRKEGKGNRYWLGKFDYEKNRFIPDHQEPRYLDGGRTVSFKVSSLADGQGPDHGNRVVAMAAIRRGGHGQGQLSWQSPLTLPRQLSLVDGELWQEPVPELTTLRGEKLLEVKTASLERINQRLAEIQSDTCEIVCEIGGRPQSPVGFQLRRSPHGQDYLRAYFDPAQEIIGTDGPNRDRNLETDKAIFTGGSAWLLYYFGTTPVYSSERPVKMRVFLDRSVCEIFGNGSVHTAWCPAPADAKGLRMIGPEDLHVESLEVWAMKSIYE